MLERFTPEGLLLAAVELAIWVAVPVAIVFLLAGLGAFTVPRLPGGRPDASVALVTAGVAGAVVLTGAVAALNLVAAIPRWTPLVIVVLGTLGLVRSASRLGLTVASLRRTLAALVVIGLVFRLGWSTLTYDAFLYHGAIVEWLAVGPVPQGFALLHSRFAFNPGLMLMMPAFRSGGSDWSHLVLVEAAVVALLVLVVAAMLTLALRQDDRATAGFQLALLAMSGLFLLLRTRGTGTDLTVAFTLVAAASVAAMVARRDGSPGLFPLLGMLAAFGILQKASATAVLVLLLAPLVGVGRGSDLRGRALGPRGSVWPSLLVALVAGLAHTARTFVMSGCLAYPVAATCIDAPWATGAAMAREESTSILVWARSRSIAAPELTDLAWVSDWSSTYLRHEVTIVLVVGAILGVVARAVARERFTMPAATSRLLWAYVVLSAVLWFVSAPNPRFGIHLHVVAAGLLAAPAATVALDRFRGWSAGSRARGRRGLLAARSRPALTLLVAVGLVYGGTMLREGRQFPVSGTVPHAMASLTLPLVGGGSDAVWVYEVPVGSDQCGDRIPCAPGPRDLVVDASGRRLVFLRSTG